MRYFAIGTDDFSSVSLYADQPQELLQSAPESWATLDVERLNACNEETSAHEKFGAGVCP